MGSPESEMQRENDETQHEVTVSDLYISATEVTGSKLLWTLSLWYRRKLLFTRKS